MTSEAKEAFLNSWFDTAKDYHWSHGMANQVEQEVSIRFDEAIQAYTRAMPDVPELVRYDLACDFDGNYAAHIVEVELGEYVLHSQAAKIIAANEARIKAMEEERASLVKRMGKQLSEQLERAEAAEAKLAEYEAQGPVAWVCAADIALISREDGYDISVSPRIREELGMKLPLYASPAPAVDLKAENERLRAAGAPLAKFCEWYDSVDELGAFPDIQDVMVPLGVLRALRNALSGKKPT